MTSKFRCSSSQAGNLRDEYHFLSVSFHNWYNPGQIVVEYPENDEENLTDYFISLADEIGKCNSRNR